MKKEIDYKAEFQTLFENDKEVVQVLIRDISFNFFELRIKGLALTKAISLVSSINKNEVFAANLINQDEFPVKISDGYFKI